MVSQVRIKVVRSQAGLDQNIVQYAIRQVRIRILYVIGRLGSECSMQSSRLGSEYILQSSRLGSEYILQSSRLGSEYILQSGRFGSDFVMQSGGQ
jgi:hypothetical protein